MVAKSVATVPTAFIGTNKNRLKIYDDRVVFLKDKQEFQFEIHNPTKDVIGVNILINGVSTSTSQLVLRPGESTWLDRYLDSPKKYVFETYTVGDTPENNAAIADNGKIEFEFYRETPKRNLLFGNTSTYTNDWIFPTSGVYGYPNSTDITMNYCSSDMSFDTSNILKDSAPTKETGRVGEGSKSNQNFNTVYYDFEFAPFHTVSYQILPESQKNAVTTDDIRQYCTKCGLRVKKSSWKFCPRCGNKF